MARTIKDARLDTRTARLELAESRKPVWRSVDRGLALGYRRGKRGGVWLGRRFKDGRYIEKRLGTADDLTDADGLTVLSYNDALQAARKWWQESQRRDRGLGPGSGAYTVARACEDYLTFYIGKGGKDVHSVRRTIDVHISPTLGSREVSDLTLNMIRKWHHSLAERPKLLRTSKNAAARNVRKIDPKDTNRVRARRATANRILTILKAALNHAHREGMAADDDAWRMVKPFRGVEAPVIRYLSADECRRLVNACPDDLRRLVQSALLTGARYGELTSLVCSDVDLNNGTIHIAHSKSGKPRRIVLTDEGVSLFHRLTAGKARGDLIFIRADEKPWKPSQQTRPLAATCERAGILPKIGFHILRHTHASTLAMQGVPMAVIAEQLGHTDTRMTERHYAHISPSYVAETIRANFPDLGITEMSNIKRLDQPRTGTK